MNNNTTDNFWNDDLVKEYTHDVIIKALNERTVSPRTWDEQILKFKQSKQSKKQGMGKPTYKLLKDLPYAKAGDPIFYSKKGDLYFCISNVNERKYFRKEIVENSKDWFQLQQPKEEQPKRFEIQGFCRSKGAISNVSGKPYNIYEFTSFELIPEDKYEAIKLAIERELNGVGSGLVQDLGLEFNLDAYTPFLKKEKLDAMMENVWNAARDAYRIQIPNGGYRYGDIKFRYESFKAYQASLPESKPPVEDKYVFDADKINGRIKRLAEMEQAFNAAREFVGGTAQNTFYDIASELKYKSFMQYSKEKSETQTTSNASLKCQNEEKKPLFTTDDGVDIFKGDDWWSVKIGAFYNSDSGGNIANLWEPMYSDTNKDHIPNPNFNGKRFSTKENAEKYILHNKPQFTFNEIRGACEERHFIGVDFLLEKLVNQKINQ